MTDISSPLPWSHSLRVADLNSKSPNRFELIPTAEIMGLIATELGLLGLKKLRLEGTLQIMGKRDCPLRQ